MPNKKNTLSIVIRESKIPNDQFKVCSTYAYHSIPYKTSTKLVLGTKDVQSGYAELTTIPAYQQCTNMVAVQRLILRLQSLDQLFFFQN